MVTVRWASSPFQGSTDPGAELYVALRANYKQLAKPAQPTAPGFSPEMSRTEHGRTKICHGVTVTSLGHKTPLPVPMEAGGTSVSSASERRASLSRRHPGRSLRAGAEG